MSKIVYFIVYQNITLDDSDKLFINTSTQLLNKLERFRNSYTIKHDDVIDNHCMSIYDKWLDFLLDVLKVNNFKFIIFHYIGHGENVKEKGYSNIYPVIMPDKINIQKFVHDHGYKINLYIMDCCNNKNPLPIKWISNNLAPPNQIEYKKYKFDLFPTILYHKIGTNGIGLKGRYYIEYKRKLNLNWKISSGTALTTLILYFIKENLSKNKKYTDLELYKLFYDCYHKSNIVFDVWHKLGNSNTESNFEHLFV